MDDKKAEFIETVIFNAMSAGPLDIYKRLDYVRILERVTKKICKTNFNPYDPQFYRKYLYIMEILGTDRALDYFGKDYGAEDILLFDLETWSKILDLHLLTGQFIAECSSLIKMAGGELDFTI